MSSLQKFHRRTNAGAPVVKLLGSAAPVAGSGFYLGMAGDGTSYMYVAPKSTEVKLAWGSSSTIRYTTSTTNGVANTNTLAGFGTVAHPAAGYCKYMTTGGYNTWYLPALAEYNTCWQNKNNEPFKSSGNQFILNGPGCYYWTSSEDISNSSKALSRGPYSSPTGYLTSKTTGSYSVRAVRRSTI
jgi:hypothetical protein